MRCTLSINAFFVVLAKTITSAIRKCRMLTKHQVHLEGFSEGLNQLNLSVAHFITYSKEVLACILYYM